MNTAYWRIVPKGAAADVYRRRFTTRAAAEFVLGSLPRRRFYEAVAYNDSGKRLA